MSCSSEYLFRYLLTLSYVHFIRNSEYFFHIDKKGLTNIIIVCREDESKGVDVIMQMTKETLLKGLGDADLKCR